MLSIISATTIRPKIVEVGIGSAATPADHATKFYIGRTTADGTGTAFTPIALDPSDPAAVFTSKYDYSAEPTYAANALALGPFGLNQRAPYRWVAMPGFELIAPATAANGLALRSASGTGTAIHECYFLVEE